MSYRARVVWVEFRPSLTHAHAHTRADSSTMRAPFRDSQASESSRPPPFNQLLGVSRLCPPKDQAQKG